MIDSPLYQRLRAQLAQGVQFLADKPEETPDSALHALWHLALGEPLSAQLASTRALQTPDDGQTRALEELVQQRVAGTPLAHLTQRQQFMGLEMLAGPQALTPRAETELLARVDALARRSADQKSPVINCGDLVINTAARTVTRDGRAIALTAREYALLEYLIVRRGVVVSRTEIEAHIYDSLVEPMSNVVDSAVCAIRRKIDAKDGLSLIETRRGMGYMISEDAK